MKSRFRQSQREPVAALLRPAVLCLAFLLGVLHLDAPAATNAVVAPMLQLSYTKGIIADPDPIPFLRVYQDGRVLIHYPHYMKRAGDYELSLTGAEMKTMLDSLYAKGVMTMDVGSLKAARAAASVDDSTLNDSFPHDAVTTVLKLRIASYEPMDKSVPRLGAIRRTIAWHGLAHDAKRHPDIDGIQGLRSAVNELLALRKRPGLVKLNNGEGDPNE